jgi:hypothetical protein
MSEMLRFLQPPPEPHSVPIAEHDNVHQRPEARPLRDLASGYCRLAIDVYQLEPSQPPLVVPPVVLHARSLVPLAFLVIVNVLPDLDFAVTT